jgi:hypothetical protein
MKLVQPFILSAGGILLSAALIRFVIIISGGQFLALADPVFGIPLRYSVLLVGILELVVAMICLLARKPNLQLGCVGWLSLNYFAFWVGLAFMGCHFQGTCVGSLSDPLRLGRGISSAVLNVLSSYLLAGSCGGIARLWFESRRAKAAAYLEMPCPACGTHIQFNRSYLGRKVSCAHCSAAVTLHKPDDYLKISCFFCKGHIEFPAHSIGEKLKCPHCKMDITLKEPATA